MKRTRVAVVGCGHLGAIHARLLAAREDVELVAIVDPVAESRERAAAAHGCRPLAEPRDLVGLVDAAVVAAPTGLHTAVSLPLLAGGIDLLVEKPIAAGVEEARALVIAARRHGRTVAVGHVERFNPAWRAVSAGLGEATFFEAVRTAPFTFRSLDVGVIHDLMIHDIDLLLSLHPGRLERVEARGITATGGFEDAARARLVFSSGLVADLTASRISPAARRTVSVWSPTALVHCDLTAKTVETIRPSAGVRSGAFSAAAVPAPERAALKETFFSEILPLETVTVADANAIAGEHDDFLAAIRDHREPLVSAAAGAAAVEIAARVIEALDCMRFGRGRRGEASPISTTPMIPHRKAG
jgi:predicted dehydrogenase